jgi:hypothetical protein
VTGTSRPPLTWRRCNHVTQSRKTEYQIAADGTAFRLIRLRIATTDLRFGTPISVRSSLSGDPRPSAWLSGTSPSLDRPRPSASHRLRIGYWLATMLAHAVNGPVNRAHFRWLVQIGIEAADEVDE